MGVGQFEQGKTNIIKKTSMPLKCFSRSLVFIGGGRCMLADPWLSLSSSSASLETGQGRTSSPGVYSESERGDVGGSVWARVGEAAGVVKVEWTGEIMAQEALAYKAPRGRIMCGEARVAGILAMRGLLVW